MLEVVSVIIVGLVLFASLQLWASRSRFKNENKTDHH
jgi:hypothetical protein